MAVADAVLIFLLSLFVGAVAILVGARLIVDAQAGFANATLTAFVGAIVWAASSLLVGWIPIVGVLLMLLAWIAVINWRYPGGWGTAVGIGFVAWIIAVAIVYAFAVVGVITPEALGIPGV